MMNWQQTQEWEAGWWGNCANTLGEELKQLLYAGRMGLMSFHNGKSPYNFNLGGATVLDIGGGPVSLLLKCINFGQAKVVDPLVIPDWVSDRYRTAGIDFEQIAGEVLTETGWDEVWLYNVLQHTQNPERIIHNACQAGQIIRIFEWIDTPTNTGHPHSLSEVQLNQWLHGEGKVERLNGQYNCFGTAYYGIFPTG